MLHYLRSNAFSSVENYIKYFICTLINPRNRKVIRFISNFANLLLHLCPVFISLVLLILLLSGDIHPNPGPNNESRDYKNITICHANIRSLRSNDKLTHIRCDLAEKYDIITLSETWLSANDKSENFLIQGFQGPIRRDRSFGRLGYGGVLLWVRNNLVCKHRCEFDSPFIENLWVEIRSLHKKILVCVIYRTNSNTEVSFWENLQNNINYVCSSFPGRILIIGDLNADPSSTHGQYLQNFVDCNNFFLHVFSPTRITPYGSSTLDQIITNFPNCLNDVLIDQPVPGCDHCVISAVCNFKMTLPCSYKRRMWKFSDTNFVSFRDTIKSHNWKCFDYEDIDQVAESFTAELLNIALKTIPNTLATIRYNDKPWYNSYLRKLKRKSSRLYRKFKVHKTNRNYIIYKNFLSFYQKELKRCRQEYDKSKLSNLANHRVFTSKKWWSILKSIYKNNDIVDQLPPLEYNGENICLDNEKANVFNEFFL